MNNFLQTLSDDDLNRMENNFKKAPSKFLGRSPSKDIRYSLEDIRVEKRRRLGKLTVYYNQLLARMRKTENGLITYKETFATRFDGEAWHDRKSSRMLKKFMDDIIQYAVAYRMPILTAGIVKTSGKLSPQALINIFERARELGYSPVPSPEALVKLEREKIALLLS